MGLNKHEQLREPLFREGALGKVPVFLVLNLDAARPTGLQMRCRVDVLPQLSQRRDTRTSEKRDPVIPDGSQG